MAVRAEQWNSHCISAVSYPSQIAPPSAAASTTMVACVAKISKTATWGQWWVLGLLEGFWGLLGGP
eukprot:8011063-Lingulodinium_polyedra.AAC.1